MAATSIPDLYKVALTKIPGVGDILAKQLVSYAGGVEQVFHLSEAQLSRIPLIGPQTAQAITTQSALQDAEKEVEFTKQAGVELLFYLDDDYPWRLKHSLDSPVLLYYRGQANLNAHRIIGIVGTRNMTSYGQSVTRRIIEELTPYGPLIVSGLAYGVDIAAHKTSLQFNLPTVAVVAHGLDDIYPGQHRATAEKMVAQGGGILTEFPINTRPNRENFPRRNRIVAGMIDALVVIESAVKGGALITAELAHSYDKEVFAVPGRLHDAYSAGCNRLIQQLKAQVLLSGQQMADDLNWGYTPPSDLLSQGEQLPLSGDEQSIYRLIHRRKEMPIDKIAVSLGLPVNKVAATLLELEFKGLIRSLPGSRFAIA